MHESESPVIELEDQNETARKSVEGSFEAAGLKEKLGADVIDRLVLLENHSRFNQDSRLIERGVANILVEIAKRKSDYGLTPERLNESRIAALIHDIGKSGPVEANPDQQLSVVKLFSVESLKNPQQSVEDALGEHLPDEAAKILADFADCGIDPKMTMLSFWESHAKWGYEILEARCPQLSSRTKMIAGSHHIDKGEAFNFYGIPTDQVPDEARLIGQLEYYVDVLQERTLIAVDKYEAQIRRNLSSHENAMVWVEGNLKGKFGDDHFMKLILQIMREMGQDNIFR